MSSERGTQSRDPGTHTFAWDRFSFDVPSDWNLSMYSFSGRTPMVRMEDDDAVRLEFDWTRLSHDVNEDRLMKRYRKMTSSVAGAALETERVDGLPAGWSGFLYGMPDKRKLLIAFWLAPDNSFFGLFRLHFDRTGKTRPIRTIRDIAATFRLSDGPLAPWSVYDVELKLDPAFLLVETSFDAGRKLFVYQWKLRRLYIWQFSVAEVILKGRPVAEFAAEFLNGAKQVRGARFTAGEDDVLCAVRSRAFIAPFENIGRMCFRYSAACAVIKEKNAVAIAVYSHRNTRDREEIASRLLYPGTAIPEHLARSSQACLAAQ